METSVRFDHILFSSS